MVSERCPDGSVAITWCGTHGPPACSVSHLSAADAGSHMVRAGAIADVPADACGDALVGRRVRVFWPCMDQLYPGLVTSYDATTCEHAMRYDDGDESQWSLFWPGQVPAFVLE